MSEDNVHDFVAAQASLVRCDGCGAEWSDLEAATHQDGHSGGRCPNQCGRLTTPVYWPAEDGTDKWVRVDAPSPASTESDGASTGDNEDGRWREAR